MEKMQVDTGFALLNFISDKVCLIEYKYGVNVTADKAELVFDHIESRIKGTYAVIDNRVRDCSFAPLEVYKVMNGRDNLKAVALVLHRQASFLGVDMEKRLFQGPLQSFRFVSDAYSWVRDASLAGYLEAPGLQHQGKTAQ